jgi:phytoene dehydrogenase-like protein
LKLSGLPSFQGVDDEAKLTGRIHIGPEIDYLERAFDASKYGEFSREPYLDITIDSENVMSIHAQFAPYKLTEGDWATRREEFADIVIKCLSSYAPNIKDLILEREVITPLDLENKYGLSGGHIHHGEQTLDQFFTFRPLIGWAQYRTPLKRLYLCGAGTHPGGGLTGLPGANAAREIARDFKAGKL